ncbi:organomercurial lyase MerB [Bradyrhizobium sp. 170]|uniref:organomercurial lyase MerB n=1 Tax=Bradyrhizobium sp. 170 TaxID=2782641 RepID=UPI001FFE382B|nr:organomercurial lyase MerB [Bradyrhizobium sp. 170]UPK03123.1 organomercurial lyase MerB [Bradyrhizobium sp. 170]
MRTDPASANLSDRLVASVGQAASARTTPGLYRALLRLLSHGEPVTITELAAAAGQAFDVVQRAVAGWNDTEYDEQGRIIGWALTLRPTQHRFNIDGRQLYTWCALDTLFFPAVIGRPARVESPCAATGVPIRLTVDPTAGVSALDPSAAVVSIVTPEQMSSVRTAFCNPGRFFATPDAARAWQCKYPGMEVLSVVDAHRASRPLSEMLLNGSAPPLQHGLE